MRGYRITDAGRTALYNGRAGVGLVRAIMSVLDDNWHRYPEGIIPKNDMIMLAKKVYMVNTTTASDLMGAVSAGANEGFIEAV